MSWLQVLPAALAEDVAEPRRKEPKVRGGRSRGAEAASAGSAKKKYPKIVDTSELDG